MKFDPKIHHRTSIRLQGYDYTQAGAYFITIVTQQRTCLFGNIIDGALALNDYGRIADKCWRAISEHFPHVELGEYVVMPNHIHGIIVIHDGRGAIHLPRTAGAGYRAPTTPITQSTSTIEQFGKPVAGSIPTIVRTYKAAVTRQISRQFNGANIWQRNYYEHVIRNADEHNRIHLYIASNPTHWADDNENPGKKP
jgi:REP element-mobilizing transposase RayT